MSYLHTPRLVFSGDFLSDVSTVNNDVAHYNNATFKKNFQDYGQGAVNGWWNPEGGATFDFQDCSVKQLVAKNGTVISTGELIGEFVKGAEGRSSGKMVDLDPQQQMCSQLWALKLRILNQNNELIFEGSIEPVGFRDLQFRQTGGIKENGQPLGASWTSVLTNIVWGEKASGYKFFEELKATTEENKLSINLNGFGYYYAHAENGRFSMGKILGAIGPWFKGEPIRFAPLRRLCGTLSQCGTGNVYFTNTNFLFDKIDSRLTIDFGASFPVENSLGTISLNENLMLAVSHIKLTNSVDNDYFILKPSDFTIIGDLEYEKGNWILYTGGIISIENIPNNIANLLKENQLVLLNKHNNNLIARESIDGYLVRADNNVQRLDYKQTNEVAFYAYQWGEKLNKAEIIVTLQKATPVTPLNRCNNPISELPGNNYPQDGITFDAPLTVKDGMALMALIGNRIDSPRGYIDGQIYFLNYNLSIRKNGVKKQIAEPYSFQSLNNMISIHLRDYFEIPETPKWSDIEYMMTQFSNLYPIMSKYLVDLSDPNALIEKKEILKFAFSRQINDPTYMPVTRDLSEAKRQTILKWLDNPIIDKPEKDKAIENYTLPKSPIEIGQELTEEQKQLKMATLAKSGALFNSDSINIKF